MFSPRLKLLCYFLLFTLYRVNCDNDFPYLKIPQGNIQGIYFKTPNGKLYEAYLGIPYAKPPVGDLRFKTAEPATPWIGTYNASTYGNDCLQTSFFNDSITGSENCLFINVYKPHDVHFGQCGLFATEEEDVRPYQQKDVLLMAKSKDDGSLFEVIADIHGGGFSAGSSSWFKPTKFMDHDIVFANFNYRLGPVGFMSTGDKFLPGNLGLKDQTLALKWIKENIKYFGGNKNKVTITGISAGGASVHYHYLSPLSKGLFRGGISTSGVTLNPWSIAEEVPKKTKIIANMMGCPTDKSNVMVDCLRTRPAEQIFNHVHLFKGFQFLPFAPFGPVVEPEDAVSPFITRHPYDIIKDGQTASVPWLCSLATHEGIIPFVEDTKLLNDLQNNWDELLPHLLDFNYTVFSTEERNLITDMVKRKYIKNKPVTESPNELIQMVGDRLFAAGIIQSALLQATASETPVYLYRFGYNMENRDFNGFFQLKENYGVAHAEELFYLYESSWIKTENFTQNDLLMSEKIINLWIKFVKTGIPTFGDLNLRPVQEGLPNIKYLEISNDNSAEVTKQNMHQIHFWATVPLNENLKLPNQLREEL